MKNIFNGKYYVVCMPTIAGGAEFMFCKSKMFVDVFLKQNSNFKSLFKKRVDPEEARDYIQKKGWKLNNYHVTDE